ncbi:zinc finger MYM-type protein 2 [Stegostoma tigrinum]|uniref:zinc finger MYM-type protein 2 n=1 Tax=Stegostoma tigrinum TaxID=3053191 RepID=UPI00286FD7A4|nr:zinc finger MYM-type protein 2 [Stegostoma tigrinum]XP_059502642.1 zinc finger MYM-type protein 2 [Stegostoma tigrinum]XP_059502643.1 zinc finger MYM-type protein 2 [Stegostoma tigrinum]XP_059502644.1 zinc finger MYM-type protein 2 [Stegostoma tigrinum]XP_059502645.1 zinc finger MYM-type protein 2 [Stegostoma tigrinum]XP_059502646.1 zinc finger MYM-type protein 2 [Stegostoma tigrinum]
MNVGNNESIGMNSLPEDQYIEQQKYLGIGGGIHGDIMSTTISSAAAAFDGSQNVNNHLKTNSDSSRWKPVEGSITCSQNEEDDDDDVVFVEPSFSANYPATTRANKPSASVPVFHNPESIGNEMNTSLPPTGKDFVSPVEPIIIDDEEEGNPEPGKAATSGRCAERNGFSKPTDLGGHKVDFHNIAVPYMDNQGLFCTPNFENNNLNWECRTNIKEVDLNKCHPLQTTMLPDPRRGNILPTNGNEALSQGISTEPDSEIQITCVTTLDASSKPTTNEPPAQRSGETDLDLMICNVTSLHDQKFEGVDEGVQKQTFQYSVGTSNSDNIMDGAGDGFLNGESVLLTSQHKHGNVQNILPKSTIRTQEMTEETERKRNNHKVNNGTCEDVTMNAIRITDVYGSSSHPVNDSWVSLSPSLPTNRKLNVSDSVVPMAPLSKPVFQSSGLQQQGKSSMKVICAHCKKPLQKGQTAYQRKGSSYLFCSTTCLSSFSHKPAPKKLCTTCKKEITNMKGTIVAQVDSGETFQEFCSTSCLSFYEEKQKTPAHTSHVTQGNYGKCTICGKMTEIRHEVSFKNFVHKLCSDVCFNKYRQANGLVMNCCDQCGIYCYNKGSGNHFLFHDGHHKRFCSSRCLNDFKQRSSKIIPCTACRTPCRSFDMTQRVEAGGNIEAYCSVACMSVHKTRCPKPTGMGSCHFCKRSALPQFQATMPDGKLYNFCSSSCVAKFQSYSVQTTTNGQVVTSEVQLKCTYCKTGFSAKPELLEWENHVFQFCSKMCCEDYKKLHCIVSYCEYCQEEKTVHETVKFSGVKKAFCSEGCKLLYKQDFAKRLGLRCVTCSYCSQMCKRAAAKEIDGKARDFCSDDCCKKFIDWYFKAARCDCCKAQRELAESVQWRGEMKHFCNQQCLLQFYCQQNEPNMSTQKGPENLNMVSDQNVQTQVFTVTASNQTSTPSPTPVKELKNKALLCKPLTQTKATYCKPHMQSKSCQTEEDWKPQVIPVPIPVPVYIPIPMHMYCNSYPVPVSMPIPVPVPVFLPTTLGNAEKIVETIEDLKRKVPSNPIEADILAMAEMIAEAEKNPVSMEFCGIDTDENGESFLDVFGTIKDDLEEQSNMPGNKYELALDLEIDFPRTAEDLDTESEYLLPPVFGEEYEEQTRPQSRRKGAKQKALSDGHSQDDSIVTPEIGFTLSYVYGITAWKHWIAAKKARSENTVEMDGLNSALLAKSAHIKGELLSYTAAELDCGLAMFVKEVRRPNGEHYAPDSLYYLCLGIQQYLFENNRNDDIFSDSCYNTFNEEFNTILRSWRPSILPNGSIFSRVEEDYLWKCKQLGPQSPFVLLNTLLYFNTKYFGLRTIEQHMRLSFANVVKQWNRNSDSTVCIRYEVPALCTNDNQDKITPGKRKREEDDPVFEQKENLANPSRCPVKMFECYLSKCPPNLQQRTDLFYLQPEHSSSPDGPIWYSSVPLDRNILENMLVRILVIKDIYEENERDSSEVDEDDIA